MKYSLLLCAAFSLTPAHAAISTVSPAGLALSAAPTQSNPARDKFRKAFENARKINAKKEQKSLVTKNTDEAAIWIIELAHAQALYPTDTRLELYADLEKAWQEAKKTEFAQEMRLYYGGLEKEDFTIYAELEQDYYKLVGEYFKLKPNEGKTDPQAIVDMGVRFEELAKKWREIKCDYFAAQCWSFVGACADKYLAKDLADLNRACDAYAETIDARERIGLKDRLHKESVLRYRELVKAGYGVDGAKAREAGGGSDEVPAPSDMTLLPMRFEVLKDPLGYERPNYFADDHYAIWHSFWLKDVGSENPAVLRYGDLWKESGMKVAARRDGASKIFIDLDGDQERTDADVDIPLKGKLEPVTVTVDVGGQPRSVAFYVQTGQESDQYQGQTANLAGNDDNFGLYATPGGVLVGELGGETITIIDEDMNGQFGGPPVTYGHVGLTKGNFHPEFDTVLIGSSKRALPFSSTMQIDKQWYVLEPAEHGTGVHYAPIEVQTGEFKLKFSGPKPAWMVLEGTGSAKGTLIDLAASSTVEAPAGEYKLLAGMVSKGKKQQLMKALVLPGAETPTWTLAAGETVEVELGGPFSFDFKSDPDTLGCMVIGNTVAIVGKAGERYERPWLCVPRPEASARKQGSRKGTKAEKMPMADNVADGNDATWFPKDLAIDVKNPGEPLEVQLTEKKNKLFGKISSPWLPVGP